MTVAGLDATRGRARRARPGPVETVGQVAEGDFDALVIPGGYTPDKLRRSETVLDLVRAFHDANKPIAFICHASWVPISAKIIRDAGPRASAPSATTWSTRAADWVDEAAVVDGNPLGAGRQPISAPG